MNRQASMTVKEKLALHDKATIAFNNGNFAEYGKIARTIPITPNAAKILQLVYGDDILEREGYNTSELNGNV